MEPGKNEDQNGSSSVLSQEERITKIRRGNAERKLGDRANNPYDLGSPSHKQPSPLDKKFDEQSEELRKVKNGIAELNSVSLVPPSESTSAERQSFKPTIPPSQESLTRKFITGIKGVFKR